jgi:mono/diheme cytochrome c family protein
LCHNADGQGGGAAPRLAPNPNMIAFAAFVRAAREPNQMPPYTSNVLSDAQLADIYAFLQTVPRPPDVSSIPLLQ